MKYVLILTIIFFSAELCASAGEEDSTLIIVAEKKSVRFDPSVQDRQSQERQKADKKHRQKNRESIQAGKPLVLRNLARRYSKSDARKQNRESSSCVIL